MLSYSCRVTRSRLWNDRCICHIVRRFVFVVSTGIYSIAMCFPKPRFCLCCWCLSLPAAYHCHFSRSSSVFACIIRFKPCTLVPGTFRMHALGLFPFCGFLPTCCTRHPWTRHDVPRLPCRQRHQMLAVRSTESWHTSEDAKIVLSPRLPHFQAWSFAAQATSEYVESL